MTLVLAALAGALIGLSLGALGGGGSILAVPVLVYLLGEGPTEATTGSLVVVGVTSLLGAITAHRAGKVLAARGVVFGAIAIGGAFVGAKLSLLVRPEVLIAAFAALLLFVGSLMAWRLVGHARSGQDPARDEEFHRPIVTRSPHLHVEWRRAGKVVLAATAVGLLTGFLGVGGGFLVVPALLLALALPMHYAAGTSLVVITITSAAALSVRVGQGPQPDGGPVLMLTVVSAVFAIVGAKVASRLNARHLQAAFTVLVLVVAVYTAARSFPALVS